MVEESVKGYFCRECGFTMNARQRPKECPYCGYQEPISKFRGNQFKADPQEVKSPAPTGATGGMNV